MKTYDYLVAYHYTVKGIQTPFTGTSQISNIKKITTFEDINELNAFIKEQIDSQVENITKVNVYNIILLGRNKH